MFSELGTNPSPWEHLATGWSNSGICCKYKITEEEIEEPDEDAVPDLSELEQIIIFSPEIQQEGFVKLPTSGEKQAPRQWGDVFLKAGDEYPFLFTVYTANYAKTQFQYYGERILPSLKDVILNKEHLDPKDIIRAVIKWVNIYCPALLGKPISLEKDSILQTLICDPGAEILCPESSWASPPDKM